MPNIIVETDEGVYVNKLTMHNIKTLQFIENFGEMPNLRTKPIFHVSNTIDPKVYTIYYGLKSFLKTTSELYSEIELLTMQLYTTTYGVPLKN